MEGSAVTQWREAPTLELPSPSAMEVKENNIIMDRLGGVSETETGTVRTVGLGNLYLRGVPMIRFGSD